MVCCEMCFMCFEGFVIVWIEVGVVYKVIVFCSWLSCFLIDLLGVLIIFFWIVVFG